MDDIFKISAPHTVGMHFQRVDGLRDFMHVLDIRTLVEETTVHHVEIRVKLDKRMLFLERFTAVRHITRNDRLRLQVLKLLAVIQMQIKMLLIGGQFQLSFLRPNDMRVLKTVGKVVNQHILQHSRLTVFMLYVDIISVDVAVKHPFGDIHFGRLLLHGDKQRPQLLLRARPDFILEEERHSS